MFEVSLLLFNAYLTVAEFGYVVDDDEKEKCVKERDEVVKRLSDHF